MSKKDYYIGDFKLSNCTQYGEYEVVSKFKPGKELRIKYEPSSKLIIVKCKKKNEWVEIGELELPEHVRKVMVPLLQGKHNEDLFDCKLFSFDINDKSINNLQVTVWAKE